MGEVNKSKAMALASTSKFFLEGIKRILEDEKNIKIVGQASNAVEVKKLLRKVRPEFLFMDNRTLKFDILHELNFLDDKRFNTKVILFDIGTEDKPISPRLIFLRREAETADLMAIVKEDCSNNAFRSKKHGRGVPKLSNRQGEVLELIKAGLSNKEIARRLSITDKTVKANLTKIFAKLDIQSRYQLMVFARRQMSNSFSTERSIWERSI